MKSFLVFLRILIVGCLWGIVFTEGIRVIMLCNWHFDIFWPDHWRQFGTMWKAGWAPHAAKEWAFIILIVTFFPMLITGWWTLSLVAWEEIIWNIIKFPYTLYQRLTGKTSGAVMPANNRYGVVKRKSYKQIRPAGINTLRVPISDYGNTATSAPLSAASLAGSSYSAPFAGTRAAAAASAAPVKKTTDVAATIDHALFKFDDDDDDFDLDIDSFEKTNINKKKPETSSKVRKRMDFDDDEDDFERTDSRRISKSFDDEDEDEEEEYTRSKSRDRDSRKNRRDDRETRRDDRETRSSKSVRSDENYDKPKKNRSTDDKDRTSSKSTSESSASPHSPVYDALTQKNYDVITNVRVGDTVIDYVGVSENDIYLCLVDKEAGDWLADEEMFNGEEPLWFSESSHRVSPVCKLHNALPKVKDALEDEGFEQDVSALVVIQMANIINADDMFDIWNDLNIEVTRINRGAPKEIKLLSKRLPEADGRVSKKDLDSLKKLLKNLK